MANTGALRCSVLVSDGPNTIANVAELLSCLWSACGACVQVVGRTRGAVGVTHPSQANGTLEVILCADDTAASSSAASGGATAIDLGDSVQARMIRAGAARVLARSSLRGPAARSAAQVRARLWHCSCIHTCGLLSHLNEQFCQVLQSWPCAPEVNSSPHVSPESSLYSCDRAVFCRFWRRCRRKLCGSMWASSPMATQETVTMSDRLVHVTAYRCCISLLC